MKQRTAELEKLHDEVKRTSSARSEYFAGLSHDFRAPLQVIRTHAELMADPQMRLPQRQWRPEFARTIQESIDHLLGLVFRLTLKRASETTKRVRRSEAGRKVGV